MPVNIRSRNHGLEVLEAPDRAGVPHAAVAIRPHRPDPEGTRFIHTLTGAEDLEYLAWKYFGSSSAWWRIADANGLEFPWDIETGTRLAIPGATEVGRVERTRSF